MVQKTSLDQSWEELPEGARVALEQQWAGLAAGGLPCGSTLVDASGKVIAAGRNHAYDRPGEIDTRAQLPLQFNRLAHAELNALALVPTDVDHAVLMLWTTQHPCSMCAAAIQFVGVGKVGYVADDPSDHSPEEAIAATHGGVPYQALGDPLWWTVSNLLFLYNSAVQRGAEAGNLRMNRERYPQLIGLTLELAGSGELGRAARSGANLSDALLPHYREILQASAFAPQ